MRRDAVKKASAVVWAVGIGVVLLILGGSILLPSTKRASPELRQLIEQRQREAAERAATQPSSQPTALFADPNFQDTPFEDPPMPSTKVLILDPDKFPLLRPPATQPDAEEQE